MAFEQFKNELPRVYKQVLAGAVRIVRAKRRGVDSVLPEGQEAADLVHEAVEKVLSGERQWDPVSVPDLQVYLTGVVRSGVASRDWWVESRSHRR